MLKKTLKIFRNLAIFLVIFGVAFSNIPFYALTGMIEGYIKTANVVDKAWHLSQNDNVVDKFTSYRNLANKIQIKEAHAAAAYIGNSNIIYTNGGTPGVITPNASTINGDLLVFYHYSRATGGNETVTLPTGFTSVFNSVTANRGLVAVGWRIKQTGDSTFQASVTNHTSSTSGETIVEFIQTYRGTDATNPIIDYTASLSNWVTSLNIGPISAPASATVTDGDMAAIFGGKFENVTGQTVLSGDSLTWAVRTTFNTTLGSDAGGIVQTGLNASGSDKTVTAKTVTATGTTQVGAGRMFIIKKAVDVSPPTPDPMTWSSAPNNVSATQIDMTATTANDAGGSTPISYLFTNNNSACGANVGTGGASSGWQSADTTYSNAGLQSNKCYGYTVQARDSLSNTGTASGISSAYTSANTPGTPTLGSPTETTLTLTNAENSNPSANPTTYFAVQVVTTSDGTWLNQWVDATGNPSASAVWLTDAQLDALVLQGLQSSTLYGVKVKARNQDTDETALSAEGQGTTSAPANALTVSTSGSQATNLNSGDSIKHIGDASTAAFQLRMSGSAVNVNTVKLTEQGGSITLSDLTNQKMYYESASTCTYNGNESNVTASPSGETVTFSFTSVPVPISPNYLCLYYVFDIDGTNAVGGETIEVEITNPSTDVALASGQNTDTAAKQLAGTTMVKPQITGYTNSTESGLNYAGSCTECGARIGGGALYRQTVVISGYGFGADPGLGSRDTSTNKVEVVGASTTMLADDGSADTNVSAWSATSITIRTDTAITGNADSDWGTNFGGASALKVTVGSQAVPANLNFYLLPQVTSLVAVGSNAAREYDAGDSDGVVTVNGTRFGTSSTGGWMRILGCDSATCSSPSGSVATTSWGNTSITAQVPTVIADNAYTGSFVVQQGNGTNNKQHQYTASGFRVLPRITSITPSADGVNPDSRTMNGNHFCQSGSCLSAASWNAAADDGDDVKFGTTNATVTGTPSNTAVEVTVPTLSPGGYTVTLYSSSYSSNGTPFTYLDNTPANPSSLNQYQSNCSTAIADEATTTSSTVCLKGAVSGGITGGTLYLQVEVRDSATGFTNATAESTGVSAPSGGTETVSGLAPGQGTFKWRARTCHWNNVGTHILSSCAGTGDYPSAWVEFETGAVPTNDFTIDSNGPIVSNISSGTPGEFNVTITWDTDELATSNINYGTTTTGPYSFIAPNPADTTKDYTSHSVPISTNLNCGTTYYYIVKSADVQETLTTSSEQTFTTGTCNPRVMKTLEFDWVEETSPITATTQQDRASLSAAIQESSDADFTIRSAVLEMRGVIIDDATTTKPTLKLWINNETAPSTPIDFPDTSSQNPQAFTVRHNIPSGELNISPLSASTNTVHFQFGGGFSKASLVNVKLIVTYDYTP
ncbi:MAG TPA: hypothetical protein VI998_03065 [Patescibacteria group bacterium]|nr:hypothetical protein [Patescibacteria group bacterium]